MTNKIVRILLVDDDQEDSLITRRAIANVERPLYDISTAETVEQAATMLKNQSIDVILLDLGLRETKGIDTLIAMRNLDAATPIVVLTGEDSEKIGLSSLDHGAQEFMLKQDANSDRLTRTIRHAISRQRLMCQQEELLVQLTTANKMLEEKNVRLGDLYKTAQQFVDNVSHEFRTPLTVIKEFCSLTRDGLAGPVTDQQQEFLNIALTRIDDLSIMVDDMLDISKLEAGLLNVWRRECGAVDVIEHVQTTIARRAESQNVQVEFDVPAGLPKIYCDSEKVGRILINLAINGIKFCRDGGSVKIVARALDNDVEFAVQDTGPGISPENLSAIFERFRQLGGSIRSSTKGFGLGLNIVKELVQLNFGRVQVESKVGEGSTFRFTVPKNEPARLFSRYFERLDALKVEDRNIALIRVNFKGGMKFDPAPVIDEFLQSIARSNDFVYQWDQREWVIAAYCPAREVADITQRIQDEWSEANHNRPLGALPKLATEVVGSWSLLENREQISGEFDRICGGESASELKSKVLLVDDDLEVIMALKVRMRAAGYSVITAKNGVEGLQAARDEKPDAIVLDVRMPVMDGLETLAELKKDTNTSSIPVVMLSASVVDQHHALEAGARFFMPKPYDAPTVISAVESSLGGGVA